METITPSSISAFTLILELIPPSINIVENIYPPTGLQGYKAVVEDGEMINTGFGALERLGIRWLQAMNATLNITK